MGIIGERCQRFDTATNALGKHLRTAQIGFRQHHLKFLTPITRCHIGRAADACLDGLGHFAQGMVATGMAMALVERPEMVHIHHQHCQRLAVALGTSPFLS
ncbi:hypothetical protein D3C79_866410 [compost metagenome]